MTILLIALFYLLQMSASCIFNIYNETRGPQSAFDFIKLTFLPYVLIKRDEIRNYYI